ncbi:hypothetical protein CK203_113080 [Vitis vinifera]|uniref:Reverse transcriptase domain-containing protein n=1 Tax=Vitis vinifera TaxID=29760 RepID=A0A438FF00_VITVI|nr:hypothetical protein CK203_113080 [Vitis vinifera]
MKRFGQVVLQVESYNMDVILQIFKRNIPSTPFFESLAKKPPATMDDLFRRADKYYMLKDDVRAASQQVLVTNRPTKNNEARSSKPLNQLRQASKRWWPEPIKTDPTKRDRNRRCLYHKDHGHTTEQCKSLHYLVEKLIKVGYLKQYVCTTGRQKEAAQEATIQAPTSLTALKVVINYIHRGPVDDRHSSKRQRYPSPNTRGHAWLHIIKVIPSTYHQMVSYLTEEGQVDLLGKRMLQRNIDIFALTRSSMSGIHVYHAIDLMFHRPRGLSGKRSSISIRKNRKSSKKKLTNYWQSDLSKMSSIQTVYIDDIVVKSETQAEHTQYLEEAFCLMRAYNMKLNPTKCAFGVNARKFLRFMVTQRGIEVNPAQVKVVLETPTPKNKKEL